MRVSNCSFVHAHNLLTLTHQFDAVCIFSLSDPLYTLSPTRCHVLSSSSMPLPHSGSGCVARHRWLSVPRYNIALVCFCACQEWCPRTSRAPRSLSPTHCCHLRREAAHTAYSYAMLSRTRRPCWGRFPSDLAGHFPWRLTMRLECMSQCGLSRIDNRQWATGKIMAISASCCVLILFDSVVDATSSRQPSTTPLAAREPVHTSETTTQTMSHYRFPGKLSYSLTGSALERWLMLWEGNKVWNSECTVGAMLKQSGQESHALKQITWWHTYEMIPNLSCRSGANYQTFQLRLKNGWAFRRNSGESKTMSTLFLLSRPKIDHRPSYFHFVSFLWY